jgi:tRNA(fMet)-specific endonuclease VapC
VSPRYLIDTDIFIHIRQKRLAKVRARFEALQPGEAIVSAVVYGELIYGAQKSSDPARATQAIEELITLAPVEPITDAMAREYGALRAVLEKRGEIIDNNDLWIAAHALSAGLILVTNNEREFKRVPKLKVQNWTV